MYSIKNVVKEYLHLHYPNTGIESLYGKYWIRFELGAPHKNGTLKRVNQVVMRACKIFEEVIGSEESVIIIEEFSNDLLDQNNEYKTYLYSLINLDNQLDIAKYPGPFDLEITSTDEHGNKTKTVDEKVEDCDIIICRLMVSDLAVKKIIRGMANLEMGLTPRIPQRVLFLNPKSGNSFYMYDDRGCDIWSPNKENLLHVYKGLNQWILDYNRAEIDLIFKDYNSEHDI